jgi:hypothetical protein
MKKETETRKETKANNEKKDRQKNQEKIEEIDLIQRSGRWHPIGMNLSRGRCCRVRLSEGTVRAAAGGLET